MKEEIKVKVKGGYIIGRRNPDTSFDGMYIFLQTDSGDEIDICSVEDLESQIVVRNYKDVYDEDYTDKYIINKDEVKIALEDYT